MADAVLMVFIISFVFIRSFVMKVSKFIKVVTLMTTVNSQSHAGYTVERTDWWTYVCRESSSCVVVLRRRSERRLLSRRNDSRNDFLNDLRRDIVLSPTPLISAARKWRYLNHCNYIKHAVDGAQNFQRHSVSTNIITTTTTVLRLLYRKTCIRRHPQLRTGGFRWSKVLLPTCPCWQQLVYSD